MNTNFDITAEIANLASVIEAWRNGAIEIVATIRDSRGSLIDIAAEELLNALGRFDFNYLGRASEVAREYYEIFC